jgi:hypothetical protein
VKGKWYLRKLQYATLSQGQTNHALSPKRVEKKPRDFFQGEQNTMFSSKAIPNFSGFFSHPFWGEGVKCSSTLHEAAAAAAPDTGGVRSTDTAQDRRCAGHGKHDYNGGLGVRTVPQVSDRLAHHGDHDDEMRVPVQRQELRGGAGVAPHLARVQMVLPLHDVRCTGGQDCESARGNARNAITLPVLQTKEDFSPQLLSKAIGTAMYLAEAANGARDRC